MSTLLYTPITTDPVYQELRLLKNTYLETLRLHLFKIGSPTGNLRIKIITGLLGTTLVTKDFDMETLNTGITKTYAHGVYSFDIGFPFKKERGYNTYRISLEAPSYVGAGYLGWCRNWEAEFDNLYGDLVVDGNTGNDAIKPYHYEIYELV